MIYLNQSATSYRISERVIEAFATSCRDIPIDGGRANGIRRDALKEARASIASFFGASTTESLIFTSGATEALNLAICGFGLNGHRVVTTAIEHNSVLRPLHRLEEVGAIRLIIVSCDCHGRVSPSEFLEAVGSDTGLAVISHASNVTGTVQAVEQIGEELRQRGIPLLIDAAQTAGHIPIHAEMAPMIAFTGHKGLGGLPGTGGLLLDPTIELEPLKTGGTGVLSQSLEQPRQRPYLYEAGTPNEPGFVALQAAVEEIGEIGLTEIANHEKALGESLLEGLRSISGIEIYGPEIPDLPVVAFRMDGYSPDDIGFILLRNFGIVVRTGLHCAPLIHECLGCHTDGSVRVSASYRNTLDDVYTFITALKEIRRSCN